MERWLFFATVTLHLYQCLTSTITVIHPDVSVFEVLCIILIIYIAIVTFPSQLNPHNYCNASRCFSSGFIFSWFSLMILSNTVTKIILTIFFISNRHAIRAVLQILPLYINNLQWLYHSYQYLFKSLIIIMESEVRECAILSWNRTGFIFVHNKSYIFFI